MYDCLSYCSYILVFDQSCMCDFKDLVNIVLHGLVPHQLPVIMQCSQMSFFSYSANYHQFSSISVTTCAF